MKLFKKSPLACLGRFLLSCSQHVVHRLPGRNLLAASVRFFTPIAQGKKIATMNLHIANGWRVIFIATP